jgi:hypothetical protein
MPLAPFVASLLEGGTLSVPAPSALAPEPTGAERGDVERLLRDADAVARLELAGRPPQLDLPAAVWAVGLLLGACQALVYRELDEAWVRAALAVPCPGQPSPSLCYSVDLAMRRLPDVHSLARGLAETDPLNDALTTLARAWPLSSVGVRLDSSEPPDTASFINDASLRRLYADRIIERADVSRLTDPLAAEAVREALGAYPGLAPPAIVAALGACSSAKPIQVTA